MFERGKFFEKRKGNNNKKDSVRFKKIIKEWNTERKEERKEERKKVRKNATNKEEVRKKESESNDWVQQMPNR